jgi:hypothetical protein
MINLPLVEAEITFIPESEGGRGTTPGLVSSTGSYRPHIVIGDPNQRNAIMIGNEVHETYLGIIFHSGPERVEFNQPFTGEFYLLYYPHPDYESVVPGATFTIREGARIVGFGMVNKVSLPADA